MTGKRDDMKRAQGVAPRPGSTVWQWAIKAPSDLRHLYPSQWAHRVSLGTTDLRTANERAAVLRAEWLGRFAAQRLALAGKITDADGPAMLARVNAVLDNLVRARLAAFDFRAATMTPEKREDAEEALDALHDHAQPAAEGITKPEPEAHDLLAEALKAAGVFAEAMTPGTHRACLAAAQMARTRLLVLQSEVLESPAGPYPKRRQWLGDTNQWPVVQQTATPTTSTTKGHTADDAFQAWLKQKPGRPAKTVAPYKAAADKLADHLNGKTLEAMTREDGRDFLAALLKVAEAKGGTAKNTAGNILSRCKTLLNVALDLEWITKSPLDRRSIPRVKSGRKPWTPADLVKLFDDPLFTAYAIPEASMAGKDAAYWLPLLGLYTGARISELAQLGIDDLRQTKEAGWVLAIHEEGKDQSVKNEYSVRTVPVHPELIRLGLADYWQAVKDAGAARLWPAVVFTELNGAGGKVSQWFGKLKESKGFGPELVFHSFRHTLETELRALSIPKYHIAALAGHAAEDISDGYAHPTPAVLRPHLERLAFPGLSLARVFKAPAWKPTDPQPKPRKPRDPQRSPSTAATSRTASRRPGPSSRT